MEILAAIKYLAAEELPALAEAGITLVGENRAQDLAAKQDAPRRPVRLGLHRRAPEPQGQGRGAARAPDPLAWRRTPRSRKLETHPAAEVLVQVNVAGEEGKAGIAPAELGDFIARCPVPVARPDDDAARSPRTPRTTGRHFARLAELAAEHGLERLSMGTTQDYAVAAQEGATIVRIGTALYSLIEKRGDRARQLRALPRQRRLARRPPPPALRAAAGARTRARRPADARGRRRRGCRPPAPARPARRAGSRPSKAAERGTDAQRIGHGPRVPVALDPLAHRQARALAEPLGQVIRPRTAPRTLRCPPRSSASASASQCVQRRRLRASRRRRRA